MCVITFFPLGDTDFVLTTNRDEAPGRPTLPPAIYTTDKARLLYPKDEVAGGTWVGVSSLNRMVALMNGGFVAHQRKNSYRMSRGIIVLKLLEAASGPAFFESFNFSGIEPFTVIMIEFADHSVPRQVVWDGNELHDKTLLREPAIWSSAPLYTPETHAVRRSAFLQKIRRNPAMNEDDIWQFHHSKESGQGSVPMILDADFVHTKSVTQLIRKGDKITSRYHDLEKDNLWEKVFPVAL